MTSTTSRPVRERLGTTWSPGVRPANDRRRALWILGCAQLVLLGPLLVREERMKRAGGPGIIPFELAGSPERARTILERWGPEGQAAARGSLLLDYPFLVAYSAFNFALSRAAGEALRGGGPRRLADLGSLVAYSQLGAGACDAAENTALLGILAGRYGRLPRLARAFASAKFGLLALGWLYAALGLAIGRRRR